MPRLIKILFVTTTFFSYIEGIHSQTMVKYIESEIHDMIYKDSQSWKASTYIHNSVNINDAESEGKKIIVKGTFIANITQWPFRGKRTINFTAEAKQVLDDITIKKVYWTQPITELYWCIGDCN